MSRRSLSYRSPLGGCGTHSLTQQADPQRAAGPRRPCPVPGAQRLSFTAVTFALWPTVHQGGQARADGERAWMGIRTEMGLVSLVWGQGRGLPGPRGWGGGGQPGSVVGEPRQGQITEVRQVPALTPVPLSGTKQAGCGLPASEVLSQRPSIGNSGWRGSAPWQSYLILGQPGGWFHQGNK